MPLFRFFRPHFRATVVLLAIALVGLQATTAQAQSSRQRAAQQAQDPDGIRGFSIKAIPFFYWNTYGLSVEVPIISRFTVGVNAMYKFGRLDGENSNYLVKHENFHENGYLVDMYVRGYFGEMPKGFYAQLGASFGDILYHDGTTRPYTFNNNWKEFDNFNEVSELPDRSNYRFIGGVGYQMVIVSRKIVGNVLLGGQVDFKETDNSAVISLYLEPSIGIIF